MLLGDFFSCNPPQKPILGQRHAPHLPVNQGGCPLCPLVMGVWLDLVVPHDGELTTHIAN